MNGDRCDCHRICIIFGNGNGNAMVLKITSGQFQDLSTHHVAPVMQCSIADNNIKRDIFVRQLSGDLINHQLDEMEKQVSVRVHGYNNVKAYTMAMPGKMLVRRIFQRFGWIGLGLSFYEVAQGPGEVLGTSNHGEKVAAESKTLGALAAVAGGLVLGGGMAALLALPAVIAVTATAPAWVPIVVGTVFVVGAMTFGAWAGKALWDKFGDKLFRKAWM